MGSFSGNETNESSLPCQTSLVNRAESFARRALELAVNHRLERTEKDGHWYGELRYDSI